MNEIDFLKTELGIDSEFYRVEADENGHVTGLSFYDEEYDEFNYDGDLLTALNIFPHLKNLSIEVGGFEITDLSGLARLPNLVSLVLDYCCTANDISVLKNLTQLTYLSINNAGITNIEALSELTLLESLFLPGNKISNIGALRNHTRLVSLNLSGNGINNIDALKNHTGLITVNFSGNKLVDISALAASRQLKNLGIEHNQLSDISCLRDLKNLEYLGFAHNKVENVDFLASLDNLKNLSFSGNPVKNIPGLSQVNSLTHLFMTDTPIQDLEAIKNNLGLQYLYAGPVKNFDGAVISRFTELNTLQLKSCGIIDLAFLSPLQKLVSLTLDDNNVCDVTPLFALKQVRKVSLQNNAITEPFNQWQFYNLGSLDLLGNPFGNKNYKKLNEFDVDVADYWLQRGDEDKALAYYYVDASGTKPLVIYYRKLLACARGDGYLMLYYVMRCERLIRAMKEEDQETKDIKAHLIEIIKNSDLPYKAALLVSLEEGGINVLHYQRYSEYAVYLKNGGQAKPHDEMLYKVAHDTLKGRENLSKVLFIYQQLIELNSPLQIALYRTIRKTLRNFAYSPEEKTMQAVYSDMLEHAAERKMPVFDITGWFEFHHMINTPRQKKPAPAKPQPSYSYERSYPKVSPWRLIARLLLISISLLTILKGCR